jgi:NADH dehydrogenase
MPLPLRGVFAKQGQHPRSVFMRARIYQPAKTAMQSGTAKTHGWVLEFAPAAAREVDPLMGWTSSGDTQAQVKLRFDSREAAEAYARDRGIEAEVTLPKPRKPNIRAMGYGENFATNRKGAWTH